MPFLPYPRCKSLGLIEAYMIDTRRDNVLLGIRGVKASASLKPQDDDHAAVATVECIRGVKASASLKLCNLRWVSVLFRAYPRCKSLGLIEASRRRRGVTHLSSVSEV